jgi:hypothetical protein
MVDHDEDFYMPMWASPYSWIFPLAFGLLVLWVEFPLVGSIAIAALFVLATGLLMTKVVFRFESRKLAWGLMPVFGGTWLLLFWTLWVLHSHFA